MQRSEALINKYHNPCGCSLDKSRYNSVFYRSINQQRVDCIQGLGSHLTAINQLQTNPVKNDRVFAVISRHASLNRKYLTWAPHNTVMAVSQNILCLNIVLQRNEKLDILDSTVKTEYTRNILYSTLSFVLLLLTSRSTFLMNIFIELWVLFGPFYLLNRSITDK